MKGLQPGVCPVERSWLENKLENRASPKLTLKVNGWFERLEVINKICFKHYNEFVTRNMFMFSSLYLQTLPQITLKSSAFPPENCLVCIKGTINVQKKEVEKS